MTEARPQSRARGSTPTQRRASKKRRKRSVRASSKYDQWELVSIVCSLLCAGYTVKRMREVVEKEFPDAELTREDYYYLVRYAARRRWLRFQPPQNHRLETAIKRKHRWLRGSVHVVHSAVPRDVAAEAAKDLVGLVQACCSEWQRDEVHIGFTGGHSMRSLAREFSTLLCEPHDDLPETIVFHALSAGFDPTDPTSNPNAFFTYFLNKPMLQIKPHFLGLSAPAMVTPQVLQCMNSLSDIRDAFAAVKGLDIIVTSGSEWSDPHCSLRRRLEESPQSVAKLADRKCVGDLLWQPLADEGPIVADTELRALSLVEIGQLPAIIRGNTRVLLMLGPCGRCNRAKGKLLQCVLKQRPPIITDLVVDSRTASEVVTAVAAKAEELDH